VSWYEEEAHVPDQAVEAQKSVPRVLLLALSYRPPDRVVSYARNLRKLGVEVDLIVADQRSGEDLEFGPGVRVHPLMRDERRHPVRRLEWLLIRRGPEAVIALARRASRRSRRLDAALSVVERGHSRAAEVVHGRLFMPFYRQLRPWILARSARNTLAGIEVGAADRIVAGDISAVTLGWRLARRHPDVVATTALDTEPYADLAPSG